jgi:hypothetical protein
VFKHGFKLGSAAILTAVVSAAVLAQAPAPAPAQAPAAAIKRTADGKPDFSGIWQGGGISARGGTANVVPVGGAAAPAAPAAGGRGGAAAAGGRGGRGGGGPVGSPASAGLPTAPTLQPWAAEKIRNYKNIDDPTVHCFQPGVPRVVGMPFPLEIVQTPNKIVILYEAFRTFRSIPTDGKLVGGEAIPGYNGDSVGHWEGDTLVVEVTNFNGKIWGPGAMRITSDKYKVTERYNLVGDSLAYEAIIEDPGVLTGPFVYRATLNRPAETRIMEYECHENNINLEGIVQ